MYCPENTTETMLMLDEAKARNLKLWKAINARSFFSFIMNLDATNYEIVASGISEDHRV